MENYIYKYQLRITDYQAVTMPAGAQMLTVQMQGSYLMLWALVDRTAPLVVTRFRVIGTGNPFTDAQNNNYVGTVQENGLVWHIFKTI